MFSCDKYEFLCNYLICEEEARRYEKILSNWQVTYKYMKDIEPENTGEIARLLIVELKTKKRPHMIKRLKGHYANKISALDLC